MKRPLRTTCKDGKAMCEHGQLHVPVSYRSHGPWLLVNYLCEHGPGEEKMLWGDRLKVRQLSKTT